MSKKVITTEVGTPVRHYEDSQTAGGARGPVLLQDYFLVEKLAHFNRERIPERIVHAKGSGAFGTFTVTNDIKDYSRAKIFSEIGKKTKVFLRFSTVGGEKGSADAERDPRGFAVKFYTEDGVWDVVGNNTPVFFIKDAKKFPDFIHTQKRDPKTNCKSATMVWDFWSHNPESLHQVMILMSDRGIPKTYRHMNGYGSHTFSMTNDKDENVYVKFHFKTAQGIENLGAEAADVIKGTDPDHAQRDLVTSIEKGDFPKWHLKIQVMRAEESKNLAFNPFDVTKVWPHKTFPLIDVGVLELNEIPKNYFASVEQSAFSPANIVDGIGFSPDKMLQGRIFAYPDAQRYRVGTNYNQLPVNRCPFAVNTYSRDGAMTLDENGGDSPNYFPNSFDESVQDTSRREPVSHLDTNDLGYFDRNENDDDHFSQAGALFHEVMTPEQRTNTVNNIVHSMNGIDGPKRDEIIQRQLCHFFRANTQLGLAVAEGLGIEISEDMMRHKV